MSILSAALPEFLGGLAAALVTAFCSWGVRALMAQRRGTEVHRNDAVLEELDHPIGDGDVRPTEGADPGDP